MTYDPANIEINRNLIKKYDSEKNKYRMMLNEKKVTQQINENIISDILYLASKKAQKNKKLSFVLTELKNQEYISSLEYNILVKLYCYFENKYTV